MTKQTSIVAPIETFALPTLSISNLNPRQHVSEQEIVEMAKSLLTVGLMQNLLGFKADNGVEIVGGGRRLRGLKHLAETQDLAATRPDLYNPPVKIAETEEIALQWAAAENAARRDLDPADEIRAYGKMASEGFEVAAVASAFAVSEKHVYRRLALANLPDDVLQALAERKITLQQASFFTVSDDPEKQLEVLDHVLTSTYGVTDHQLKNLLAPTEVSLKDRRAAFVGAEAYEKAGGAITRSLFDESAYFQDTKLLETLFESKLSESAAKVADGWLWVETMTADSIYNGECPINVQSLPRLYPIAQELSEDQQKRRAELNAIDYDELSEADHEEIEALEAVEVGTFSDDQKSVSGLLVFVAHGGKLSTIEGLVKPEDQEKAVELGVLENHRQTAPVEKVEKHPFSQALQADIGRVCVAAKQTAMLDQPELLLAILAFELTGRARWDGGISVNPREVTNSPSILAGFELLAMLRGRFQPFLRGLWCQRHWSAR